MLTKFAKGLQLRRVFKDTKEEVPKATKVIKAIKVIKDIKDIKAIRAVVVNLLLVSPQIDIPR